MGINGYLNLQAELLGLRFASMTTTNSISPEDIIHYTIAIYKQQSTDAHPDLSEVVTKIVLIQAQHQTGVWPFKITQRACNRCDIP